MNQIITRLKDLDDQIAELHRARTVLEEKLVDTVIYQINVMNEAQWRLDGCSLKSHTSRHKKFSELLQKTYHQAFAGKSCDIYFDDSDITLHFKDENKLSEFIKTNKISINIKDIEREVKQAQRWLYCQQDLIEDKKELLKRAKKLSAK